MERRPTYAGTIEEKDNQDILYWAMEKTPAERLAESWRLHCVNHNVPTDISIDKNHALARKRNG